MRYYPLRSIVVWNRKKKKENKIESKNGLSWNTIQMMNRVDMWITESCSLWFMHSERSVFRQGCDSQERLASLAPSRICGVIHSARLTSHMVSRNNHVGRWAPVRIRLDVKINNWWPCCYTHCGVGRVCTFNQPCIGRIVWVAYGEWWLPKCLLGLTKGYRILFMHVLHDHLMQSVRNP